VLLLDRGGVRPVGREGDLLRPLGLLLAALLAAGCDGDVLDGPFLDDVTCPEFRDLREGMTLDEANRVVGDPGEFDRQTEAGVRYRWDNWDGSHAWAEFENGQLVEKGESGVCD
jgi:hypothetical protein